MPRKKAAMPPEGSFGQRLAKIRNEAGLTQRQLGDLAGISHRMVAYYEKRDPLPPGHVLAKFAEAFGLSSDQLLGKKKRARAAKQNAMSQRLRRRFQELEKLPLSDKKALLAIIDTYIEKHRLAQRTGRQ